MKGYLRTLWLALIGRSYYREENEKLKNDLESYKIRCESKEILATALTNLFDDCRKSLNLSRQREENLQSLVENLRESLSNKDAIIENDRQEFREKVGRVKLDYQRRIRKYMEELDALHSELQQAKGQKITFENA